MTYQCLHVHKHLTIYTFPYRNVFVMFCIGLYCITLSLFTTFSLWYIDVLTASGSRNRTVLLMSLSIGWCVVFFQWRYFVCFSAWQTEDLHYNILWTGTYVSVVVWMFCAVYLQYRGCSELKFSKILKYKLWLQSEQCDWLSTWLKSWRKSNKPFVRSLTNTIRELQRGSTLQ